MRPDTMFRDEAILHACAGNGGNGCSSYLREKYVPFGGPDGGDGGRGGGVILVANENEGSLFHVSRNREARADSGRPGTGHNRHGRSGEDRVIVVPVGTQVRDLEHGNLLADLDRHGSRVVIAAGGRGGRGNARFANATNRAPHHSEEGRPGEDRTVLLELKLVADLGLVGLPNAGKSTLLARLTAARPRVAAYPFTTLDPSLGIYLAAGGDVTVVLADIPGLIEGAAKGKGLGHQFLRHLERTRALLHLADCSSAAEDPVRAVRSIREELRSYSVELASRPCLLLATKVEDDAAETRARELFAALGEEGLMISAVTGRGLEELGGRMQALASQEA